MTTALHGITPLTKLSLVPRMTTGSALHLPMPPGPQSIPPSPRGTLTTTPRPLKASESLLHLVRRLQSADNSSRRASEQEWNRYRQQNYLPFLVGLMEIFSTPSPSTTANPNPALPNLSDRLFAGTQLRQQWIGSSIDILAEKRERWMALSTSVREPLRTQLLRMLEPRTPPRLASIAGEMVAHLHVLEPWPSLVDSLLGLLRSTTMELARTSTGQNLLELERSLCQSLQIVIHNEPKISPNQFAALQPAFRTLLTLLSKRLLQPSSTSAFQETAFQLLDEVILRSTGLLKEATFRTTLFGFVHKLGRWSEGIDLWPTLLKSAAQFRQELLPGIWSMTTEIASAFLPSTNVNASASASASATASVERGEGIEHDRLGSILTVWMMLVDQDLQSIRHPYQVVGTGRVLDHWAALSKLLWDLTVTIGFESFEDWLTTDNDGEADEWTVGHRLGELWMKCSGLLQPEERTKMMQQLVQEWKSPSLPTTRRFGCYMVVSTMFYDRIRSMRNRQEYGVESYWTTTVVPTMLRHLSDTLRDPFRHPPETYLAIESLRMLVVREDWGRILVASTAIDAVRTLGPSTASTTATDAKTNAPFLSPIGLALFRLLGGSLNTRPHQFLVETSYHAIIDLLKQSAPPILASPTSFWRNQQPRHVFSPLVENLCTVGIQHLMNPSVPTLIRRAAQQLLEFLLTYPSQADLPTLRSKLILPLATSIQRFGWSPQSVRELLVSTTATSVSSTNATTSTTSATSSTSPSASLEMLSDWLTTLSFSFFGQVLIHDSSMVTGISNAIEPTLIGLILSSNTDSESQAQAMDTLFLWLPHSKRQHRLTQDAKPSTFWATLSGPIAHLLHQWLSDPSTPSVVTVAAFRLMGELIDLPGSPIQACVKSILTQSCRLLSSQTSMASWKAEHQAMSSLVHLFRLPSMMRELGQPHVLVTIAQSMNQWCERTRLFRSLTQPLTETKRNTEVVSSTPAGSDVGQMMSHDLDLHELEYRVGMVVEMLKWNRLILLEGNLSALLSTGSSSTTDGKQPSDRSRSTFSLAAFHAFTLALLQFLVPHLDVVEDSFAQDLTVFLFDYEKRLEAMPDLLNAWMSHPTIVYWLRGVYQHNNMTEDEGRYRFKPAMMERIVTTMKMIERMKGKKTNETITRSPLATLGRY